MKELEIKWLFTPTDAEYAAIKHAESILLAAGIKPALIGKRPNDRGKTQ